MQTCESVFARFQEHVSKASRLTILAGLLFEFELVYAALANAGFCCCKLLPIEKCIGISGILSITLIIPCSNLLLLLWKENGWVFNISFFQRGYNLESKSNNRRSPSVHKPPAIRWSNGHKPNFVGPNNKVWVAVCLRPCLSVSLPPPHLPIWRESGSSCNDVQLVCSCSIPFTP